MRLIAALLAASLPLAANGRAQLLPFGDFAARDGRPGKGLTWKVNDEQGIALAAQLNGAAARTPIVIDYEHQTMLSEKNGQPAPAAGWMKRFEWLAGQGLFAEVEWTAKAKAHIDAGEYRYISPVMEFDKDSGRVLRVLNAALVNFPALLGMEPVMARLSSQYPTDESTENDMAFLAALIAALGMQPTATETEVTAAIKAQHGELQSLKAKPAIPPGLVAALGVKADADEATAVAALAALKGGKDADSTRLAALGTELATLQTKLLERDLNELLDSAIAAKKITPAQRASLADIGKKDFAWLKTHVAGLAAIPGLEGQGGGDGERTPDQHNGDAQDLARRATVYQQAQLKAGVEMNIAQAVAAVAAGAK